MSDTSELHSEGPIELNLARHSRDERGAQIGPEHCGVSDWLRLACSSPVFASSGDVDDLAPRPSYARGVGTTGLSVFNLY